MKNFRYLLSIALFLFIAGTVFSQQPVDYKSATYGEPSRSAAGNDALDFAVNYDVKKFNTPDKVYIRWKLEEDVTIEKIFIVDVTSEDMNIIWKTEEWDKPLVNAKLLEEELKEPFKEGHFYKLNIHLSNKKSSTFNFFIQ